MTAGEKLYNDGYNQGMDHAIRIIELIFEYKLIQSIAEPLLKEIKTKIEEVKKIQAVPLEADEATEEDYEPIERDYDLER